MTANDAISKVRKVLNTGVPEEIDGITVTPAIALAIECVYAPLEDPALVHRLKDMSFTTLYETAQGLIIPEE